MQLSRRDTIIIALFVNVALLILLFATATHFEEQPLVTPEKREEPLAMVSPEHEEYFVFNAENEEGCAVDEIDRAVQEYALQRDILELKEKSIDEPVVLAKNSQKEGSSSFFEIQVKKGDVLSKLAKMYGVSIDDIRKYSNLTTDRLHIGQMLKIPKKVVKELQRQPVQTKNDESCFYIVKNGDNPWKIARKFHLGFEELLEMNQLDEEKAKNLKIGQKIRIRK